MEAGGLGIESGRHAARLTEGSDARPSMAQGYKNMFLQDADGQMKNTHSIAASLDYVGVSPNEKLQKGKLFGRFRPTNQIF